MQKHITFLLNYSDFSCPPCFESFSTLADSLNQMASGNDRITLAGIFREDGIMKKETPERLTRWKEANRFDFPFMVASDSQFVHMNTGKSAVVIWKEDHVLFFGSFPLSSEQFETVFSVLQ